MIQSSKYFLNFELLYQIVECNATQNCSGQGICGQDGACECNVGFYMEDCSSKLMTGSFVFNTVLTYYDKNCD